MEKLKIGDYKIESDDSLIQQMKEALYACPNVLKLCKQMGMTDEVIDDNEAKLIKDSEKNYMDLIAKITKSYGSNIDERAEFEQQYTSDNVWNRMADLNAKLADTEGYIKLSLTINKVF